MLYLAFVIITFVWLLFACISDFKTREVPNWLNFSLIAIGLGGRLIYSLVNSQWSYFLYGFWGFGIFFVIANIMYYTKQWGGGDGKLLMGLGAMFGDYQNVFNAKFIFPFLVEFFINMAISGAIFGLAWSVYLVIKNRKKFLEHCKTIKKTNLTILFMLTLILSFVPSLFFKELLVFGIIIPVLYLILVFIHLVDKCCMYKHLKVDKLTEGDWIAEEVKVKEKIIAGPKDIGITKKQIELLKQYKIKLVLVKEGIPFVFAFLLGFILTVFFGNLVLYFF